MTLTSFQETHPRLLTGTDDVQIIVVTEETKLLTDAENAVQ